MKFLEIIKLTALELQMFNFSIVNDSLTVML